MLKRILRSPASQQALGSLGAAYLRFVRRTSRVVIDPPDLYERLEPLMPCIVAMWHGQHFVVPFLRRPYHDVRVLISPSADGLIQAHAVTKLGMGVIRGSGGSPRAMRRKRGHLAFREMLQALEEGATIALTADVPKTSRVAGMGIVQLARRSGRAVFCTAVTTSRRITLRNWDRSAINLPFSRLVVALDGPIFVPPTDDPDTLEAKRREIEDMLNAVHMRAWALAGGAEPAAARALTRLVRRR
jgi:lysophospholipid acyltransferase (LPLAT)-like uncharacterized protein